MSKYLFFTDAHFKGKNGANRIGNFFEDMLLKFDELLEIAKRNKCKAILDGGDLFDRDNPSYRIIDEVADRVEKANIPFYSLHGNHAMSYGHIENSKYTALSHLQQRSKLFHSLVDVKFDDIEMLSIDYYFGVEEDLKKNGIIFKESDKWRVALIHALITPKPFFKQVSHLTTKELKTNGDLILLGHYHQPFIQKIKNVEFVNIGCFGRNSITESNIKPSVLILDTKTRSHEVIELKSAKKGTEVFNLKEEYQSEANLDDFIQSLESVDFQGMSVAGMVQEIGKKEGVGKDVIDLILNKIEEVK